MKRLLSALIVLLMLGSIAGLGAGAHWFLDLFNHFRIQALLGSLVLLGASCAIDRRHLRVVGMLVLLNAALVGWRLYQTMPMQLASKHAPLTIVASNVLGMNTRYDAVLEMVAREQPEVLVITEATHRWVKNLDSLHAAYPYRFIHSRDDNFGIAIYAKRPFEGTVRDIGHIRVPLVVADFDGFRLIAAHPVPPMDGFTAYENRHYLEAVARFAQMYDGAVVVAGDLNATLWSNALAPLLEAGLKRTAPFGLAYTWPSAMLPLAIQIDHFLVKGMAAQDFRVLENVGSDHFPIAVSVTP